MKVLSNFQDRKYRFLAQNNVILKFNYHAFILYRMIRFFVLCIVLFQSSGILFSQGKAGKPLDLTKEKGDLWRFEGAGKWEILNNSLVIVSNTITDKPFRIPSARAIYKVKKYGTVEITANIKSNATPEQVRGDIIIIFGYQSPTQFYYAHFTGTVDEAHNGVFIVDNADRRKLEDKNAIPFLPDREWHQVRLSRNITSGEIKIFVDNSKTPSLVLTDKTFLKGYIGVGSFNDPGEIKDIIIAK